MTSSSQNPLLSLNFENPKDGFKHLKRLQADFDCVEALTKHHNAQAVPKAVVEALARSFRELASKIAQDETDEDSSSVNESSDSIIRASSAKPSEANLYTGDAGVRLISDVSDQNLTSQASEASPLQEILSNGHNHTYTVVVNNFETTEPKLDHLEHGIGSAAKFILDANQTHLSLLKSTKDIKNIQWIRRDFRKVRDCGLLIEFSTAELANEAIAEGVRSGGSKIRDCWKFIRLCTNCYALGHSVNICVKPTRCAKCSGGHPLNKCTSRFLKCTVCSGPHVAEKCDVLMQARQSDRLFNSPKELWTTISIPAYESRQVQTVWQKIYELVAQPSSKADILYQLDQIKTIVLGYENKVTNTIEEPRKRAQAAAQKKATTQDPLPAPGPPNSS